MKEDVLDLRMARISEQLNEVLDQVKDLHATNKTQGDINKQHSGITGFLDVKGVLTIISTIGATVAILISSINGNHKTLEMQQLEERANVCLEKLKLIQPILDSLSVHQISPN